MLKPSMQHAAPQIECVSVDRETLFKARGDWVVQTLAVRGQIAALQVQVGHGQAACAAASWDLSGINRIDHLGAQFFWNLWGRRRPAKLVLDPRHEAFFDRLYHLGEVSLPAPAKLHFFWIIALGSGLFSFLDHVMGFVRLLGQLLLDILRLVRNPLRGPWTEISAGIFHAGAQAMGITALVGFLIGVVLSYLSSQQLRLFGADIYIVNILGLSIIRELGPLLAAILVAGRSGSAITAQLGVMRVTEELDALLVMGIPHGFRLILPRVLALGLAMPLVVVWTDAMALVGGMVSAKTSLGLSFSFFLETLPNVVKPANIWLGVGKGAVFGMLIGLTACHFGLRIQPNTTSLGQGTTASVVTAITIVILADAVFAILFKSVGI
jgi:phospholipid/cholesterol/gamma-HCH transport system permease protein